MSKSPAAAAILTLLLTSLGQFYNHQFVKGMLLLLLLLLLVLGIVTRIPLFYYSDPGRPLVAFLVVVQVGIFAYAVADAYVAARRHKQEWMSAFPSWTDEAEPHR